MVIVIITGGFIGFVAGFGKAEAQKYTDMVQNYITASSYAVKGKILQNEEDVNSSYVNKILANKNVESEFGSDFI